MDIVQGSWGKLNKPIVVRTTYYLNTYDEFGSTIGPEDNQQISVYAQRLSKVVDSVKSYTGKKKVIIIAHSMGGLVAREYIRNGGKSSVDKLITIGTPNHGIYADIASNCESLIGRSEASPECSDMITGSTFLTMLNQQETFDEVEYMTITGSAINKPAIVYGIAYYACNSKDGYHDEVVCASSVPLNGAVNKIIDGTEVSGTGTFHGDLIHPLKVPKTYEEVVNFLNF